MDNTTDRLNETNKGWNKDMEEHADKQQPTNPTKKLNDYNKGMVLGEQCESMSITEDSVRSRPAQDLSEKRKLGGKILQIQEKREPIKASISLRDMKSHDPGITDCLDNAPFFCSDKIIGINPVACDKDTVLSNFGKIGKSEKNAHNRQSTQDQINPNLIELKSSQPGRKANKKTDKLMTTTKKKRKNVTDDNKDTGYNKTGVTEKTVQELVSDNPNK